VYKNCDKTGPALKSSFGYPSGIAIDAQANIYLLDKYNHVIRKLGIDGNITVFAGGGSCRKDATGKRVDCFRDGKGTQAEFYRPSGISLDLDGNLYVADTNNHKIRKITPDGQVTTIAGSTQGYKDGPAAQALFSSPSGLTVDHLGNIYVADTGNHRIRTITPEGKVYTLAGNGSSRVVDNTDPTKASFDYPSAIVTTLKGDFYVASQRGYKIRKISNKGVVTTLAGSTRGSRDGSKTTAQFSNIYGLTLSPAGTIIVADTGNNRIREVSQAGLVKTIAGTSGSTWKDGPARLAQLVPYAVAYDVEGNLYIADSNNRRFRKLTRKAPTPCTKEDATQSCYNGDKATQGKSPCTQGTQRCEGGFWSLCSQQILPTPERCNGKDDDCDGQVDNNLQPGPLCQRQYGSCVGVRQTSCTNGKWDACTTAHYKAHNPAYKATETCNGVDDNCNGLVDEHAAGCVSTLVGSSSGYSDGAPQQVRVGSVQGIAVHTDGTIYISDSRYHRIRKIQPDGYTTTIAGDGNSGSVDGVGLNAKVHTPSALAISSDGQLYFFESGSRLRKIDTNGNVTTIAGSKGEGSEDGVASSATFNRPGGLTIDPHGNIYIADTYNHTIRKLDTNGFVSTIAGTGQSGNTDGPALQAKFNYPAGIAIDTKGNLYISDRSNYRIRKLDTQGNVTTFAGSRRGILDGTGTTAKFQGLSALSFSTDGDLYLLDEHLVRRIAPDGKVTTVSGTTRGFKNGALTQAQFYSPKALALDTNGTIYIADTNNYRVRMVTIKALEACSTEGSQRPCYTSPSNTSTTGPCKQGTQRCNFGVWSLCQQQVTPIFETCNGKDDDCDGQVDNNLIHTIACAKQLGVCAGTSRQQCVSGSWSSCTTSDITAQRPTYQTTELCDDVDNNCDGRINEGLKSCVSTIAGSIQGDQEGSGLSARFTYPFGIVADASGNFYIADMNVHKIRKLDTKMNVTTFAGNSRGKLDGTTAQAKFYQPRALALDSLGNLYIGDARNYLIRKIDTQQNVTTVAGKGTSGYLDGLAAQALFGEITGLVATGSTLYAVDQTNNSIRKIASGRVSTFAGSSTRGSTDGTGTSARFYRPHGIAQDKSGHFYVTDSYNHLIRKIDPSGKVTTIAGTGQSGNTDGPALQAKLQYPKAIIVAANGDIYFSDAAGSSIRKLSSGTVTTLVGSNRGALDGPLSSALFGYIYGLAFDTNGDLIATDYQNHTIRRITFP
tara:strand:+ start:9917 stop:13585 length:3669 start_codon:yes stop_codon:yes gene_type:complete